MTGKEQNKLPFLSFPLPLASLPSSSSISPSSSLDCLSSSDGSRTMAAARAQKTSKPPDMMKGKGKPPQSKRSPPVQSNMSLTQERNQLPMKGPNVVPTPFMVSIHEMMEHSLKRRCFKTKFKYFQFWVFQFQIPANSTSPSC